MRELEPTWSRGSGPEEPGSAGLRQVLEFVRLSRAFDSTGYCLSVIEKRVEGRLRATGASGYEGYLRLLESSPAELGVLVESLTIKVSSFFRNPLAFEYLGERILPAIFAAKERSGDRSFRAWSAGCAGGEEPYSLAILLRELGRRRNLDLDIAIFATDVDEKALARGREALYPARSLENVRQGLVSSAFTCEGGSFRVTPEVAGPVRFSVHDMLDRRTAAPAESVFGTFDLILCRNLLIYFDAGSQEIIFRKLYRALADGGYVVLGRTETLSGVWQGRLRRVTDCCSLYRKTPRGVSLRKGQTP